MDLSDKEIEELISLKKQGFHWLARDEHGTPDLYAYVARPIRNNSVFSCLFPCDRKDLPTAYFKNIKWEDEEPTSIDELMKENNLVSESDMADWIRIDNINPDHYKIHAMECIEEMKHVFGIEDVKIFCKLNAWKYRYRSSAKGGMEDEEKADWYLQKLKELNEQQ